MTNDFDIANLALSRLGAVPITSLADGSRNADAANLLYESLRDEELARHPWAFATRRATLEEYVPNVLTITDITSAEPPVVQFTGTDPEEGDEYVFTGVTGMTEVNGVTYTIMNIVAATSFELYDASGDPVDGALYAAYVAAGTAEEVAPLSSSFNYLHVLPSDCLLALSINEDPSIEFEVDPKGLMSNEPDVDLTFIRKITDVAKFTPAFNSLFAWRLAQDLAIVITGSVTKFKMAAEMYVRESLMAQAQDANTKRQEPPTTSRYKNARR